jgi:N-acetylmuramoyl-L-alanine amidase
MCICDRKKGDIGDEVTELQTKLARYGYGIITDGVFEVKTEFVVKAFQRHFAGSQPISGIWDDNLERKINHLLDII